MGNEDGIFHVCKCCGESFGIESQDTANPHICRSCARLAEDIQDDMIIQTAVPHRTDEESEAPEMPEDKGESRRVRRGEERRNRH